MNSEMQTAFQKLESDKKIKWLNKDTGKYFLMNNGKFISVTLETNQNKVVNFIRQTNYNHAYARTKINHLFTDFNFDSTSRLDFFDNLKKGDIIRILENTDDLDPGDDVPLPSSTEYYSVNDGAISCNGVSIGDEIIARFHETDPNECMGSSTTQIYSIFEIL
ncbi:hypothetical protein [Croceivirga thetidis]|uniref:Uncharacterized protein n=1 Tax=Croceivirga thetidis TaxID=2721623 RepID=A0ABX1GL50_9FLAO|nr:hypothetical protein [Croceivirga thetidis]NKI30579.1 hypothetical protein [Croceivirga thetidis]